MNESKFIVFEGCEGSGKTTQINKLNNWLHSQNIKTWVTKEPGGCVDQLNVLRELILCDSIKPNTELLLILADRSHHSKQIRQALNDNAWVLCDRFSWSTLAYQGYGDGFDLDMLKSLDSLATNGLRPDLTILLDVDVKVGLERKASQKEQNKMELRKIDYHNRVREGYLKLFEATLLSQDTACRLLYHKDKNSGRLYTQDEIFEKIVQSFPF